MKKIILLIIVFAGISFSFAESDSGSRPKHHIKKIKFTEKDGNIVVIRISRHYKRKDNFFLYFTNFPDNVENVFNCFSNSPDDTVLVAYTNSIGDLNISVTNSRNFDSIKIRARQRKKATGNKIADIKKIKIDNQIKCLKIKGNIEKLLCGKMKLLKIDGNVNYIEVANNHAKAVNSYNSNIQYSNSYMSLNALYGSKNSKNYSIRKLQLKQLSNSFIKTSYGGFKLLRVKQNIFKTTILTGTELFDNSNSNSNSGIKNIIVGKNIEQADFFLAPQKYSFTNGWEEASASIKKIKAGSRKNPGIIQNAVFLSLNTNIKFKANIGTNVFVF